MKDSSKWGVRLPFGPYTSQAWGAVWVGGSDEDWVYIGEGGGLWTGERGCSGLRLVVRSREGVGRGGVGEATMGEVENELGMPTECI